tara:strand:- start:193 stop:300 length:108 start_codon:yes stop_codon:yes gene_type:complete
MALVPIRVPKKTTTARRAILICAVAVGEIIAAPPQ